MKCASSPLQREAHKHKIFLRIWLDRPDASKGYFLNRPNSCFKEKGNSESLKPQRIRYGWNGNWGMMKKMQSSLNFRWSSIWTSSLFGSPETRSSGLIKHKSEFTPHIQDNDIVQDIYPQCKAGNYDDRPLLLIVDYNGRNSLPWGEVTAVSCFLSLGLDSHTSVYHAALHAHYYAAHDAFNTARTL